MDADTSREYLSVAEDLANAQKNPVPRDYISEALEQIETGVVKKVGGYPGGNPSFEQVLALARKLYQNRFADQDK